MGELGIESGMGVEKEREAIWENIVGLSDIS